MTPNSTNVTGALLGLHAQTSLHPGSGTALGTVDLPVQRERHTHWPTIAGSALKGILRDTCREKLKVHHKEERDQKEGKLLRSQRQVTNEEDPLLVAAFGPGKISGDQSDAHAGALSVTDARLLAFPVRSLKGVFAWVSCPAVLQRLQRDWALVEQPVQWRIPDVFYEQNDPPKVAVPTNCRCLVGDTVRQVVLEEFDFTALDKMEADVTTVATWIANHLLPRWPSKPAPGTGDAAKEQGGQPSSPPSAPAANVYEATRERFLKHFLILSDDDFTYFARHATEVTARIALNYDTKTVKGTALFYQEFLPAETLMYAVVLANDSRRRLEVDDDLIQKHPWLAAGRGIRLTAGLVQRFLTENLPPGQVLQIGGDETTGKGLCAVRLSNGKDGAT
jgi:CRISPR-associated protein Cmr4